MSVNLIFLGSTTAASVNVTGITAIAPLAPGLAISGAGIPAGASIAAIVTGGLTLDSAHAATATASGVTLTVALPGFTALLANRIQDAGGNLLTGTLQVLPTDGNDLPVAAVAGGAGGPIAAAAIFSFAVGVLQAYAVVPDSSITTNPWTSYRFTFFSPNGTPLFAWKGVQPQAASLNLDTYQPILVAPQAIIQAGPSASIAVAGVTSLAAGSTPTVVNLGTSSAADLQFGIPVPAVTLAIGTVTGLATGATPTVVNVGSSTAAILNLGLPAGPAGSTTGMVTLDGLSGMLAALYNGRNIYNKATTLNGYLSAGNTPQGGYDGHTLASSGASYGMSAPIPANAGGVMGTSVALLGGSSVVAHFDANMTWLRDTTGTVAANGTWSCLSDEGFVQVPYDHSVYTTPMVYFGATAPSTFVDYHEVTPTEMTTAIAAAVASQFAIAERIVEAHLPAGSNMFDETQIMSGHLILTSDGSFPAVAGYYVSGPMPVIAGRTYNLREIFGAAGGVYCAANYDVSGNLLQTFPVGYGTPQNFTPTQSGFFRFSDELSNLGNQTQMFTQGNVAPSSYVPFMPRAQVITEATVSPGLGRPVGVLGDSISSIFSNKWQNVVIARLGMHLAWQSARPGRAFSTALEDWSTPAVGSAPGNYSTSYTYPGVGGNATTYLNTGITSGQSLSASLAALAGGALILRLGTNDMGVTVGTLGDSISSGSLYGNMRWVIEELLTAAPEVRLVMVGPALNGQGTMAQIQAVDAAEQAIADYYSLPYLSLLKRGGNNIITNSSYTRDSSSPTATFNTSGTTLSGMGTHPSDWNFANVDGPAIAQFLQQWI